MKRVGGEMIKTIKFEYNGFHGRSYHILRIRPNQIDAQGQIHLTPAQLRRHRICNWKDCSCGEEIAYVIGPPGAEDYILKPISKGVMAGNYPQ
jgi:hypothetical protein